MVCLKKNKKKSRRQLKNGAEALIWLKDKQKPQVKQA